MSDREYDLVVFGATGLAGRLLAAYLAREAPSGMRVALAGRSRERLENVRADLPAAAQEWPLVVCDATDHAQVAHLARSTRVVVTTVGPYARYGLQLVRACAEAGTHYADLTGEVLFVRDAIDAAHETAASSGARIVTACGFDSIPSDLGVLLLFREAERQGLGGLGDTTLLVTRLSGGISGGTVDSIRSQVEALEADPERRRILHDPFALSADHLAGPDRSGQRDAMYVYRDATTGRWTAPWLMASFNSRIVRRTDSLLGHAYGPTFRYREAVAFGRGTRGRLEAYVLAAALGTAFTVMSNPRIRPLADRVLPSPGEGPGAKAREEGYFRFEICTTTASGSRLRSVVAAQGDPGYAATVVMLGESALCLAEDEERLGSEGGVLTPAVAMGDVLVERLRIAGMTLSVGPDAG
ncbi:MAG TPA: saccharopine dehydrogenase NADP-binding domain-containing protein [Lapillicoccus sp.]|nr:saccharopine dehydrogenase NADP-binding domain-containing protein [Lapillicoccus sp.]